MTVTIRIRTIALFLILLLVFSTGCLSDNMTTGSEMQSTEPAVSATPSPAVTSETTLTEESKPTAASGVLRLWWSSRKTLNPLLDRSQSGHDVNDLIYQSLFSLDTSKKYTPQLATGISYSPSGLLATIELRSDVVFHNDKKMTAADVVGCINFILTNAAQSDYAAALSSVSKAEAVDAQTVRIYLKQANPWLPYALIFPIIPASSLTADPFALVPGSGPFQMKSYDSKKGLVLQKVHMNGEISELKTIQIREYASLAKAMKAYENDLIDLINLPADEYSRYMVRNSLRFEQYSGNELLFLSYNTQETHLLSNEARLLFLKKILYADKISAAGAGVLGEITSVPLSVKTGSLANADCDYKSIINSLGKSEWTGDSRKLKLLVSSENAFQKKIMAIICKLLDHAGIKWQLETLSETDYWAAVKTGKYDLTLMEAVMPDQPDPNWLYKRSRPAAFALLNTLDKGGLADYDLWRQKLNIALSVAQESRLPNGQAYADTLYQTAVRSPWEVIMIRTAAVLYGDRVIGQCQPDEYHPYKGIEELWIWSGQ